MGILKEELREADYLLRYADFFVLTLLHCFLHRPCSLDNASNYQVKGTTIVSEINSSDISFPLNRKGSSKPLKTLWRSTKGVQSPSTLPTQVTYASSVGVGWGRVNAF